MAMRTVPMGVRTLTPEADGGLDALIEAVERVACIDEGRQGHPAPDPPLDFDAAEQQVAAAHDVSGLVRGVRAS
jgi:hypothetical protein